MDKKVKTTKNNRSNSVLVIKSKKGLNISVVNQNSRLKNHYISEQDKEMDRLAQEAVNAAIKKARVCGKPVARFDFSKGKAYLEYSDGQNKYIN